MPVYLYICKIAVVVSLSGCVEYEEEEEVEVKVEAWPCTMIRASEVTFAAEP